MSVCENQSTFQNNALLLLFIHILIHFHALTLQIKETSQLGCAEFLFSVYSMYILEIHNFGTSLDRAEARGLS